MAFGIFLQIDTIQGESTDSNHRGWIDLSSLNFGASNPASVDPRGISSGQPTLSNFLATKQSDLASAHLWSACTQSKIFAKMRVEICQQSGDKIPFAIYEFNNVLVAGIQWSGAGGTSDRPGESVSFAFGSVQYTYTPIGPNGKPGTKQGPFAWNVLNNSPRL